MRRLIDRFARRVLPTATGQASPELFRCYRGCGRDGVLVAVNATNVDLTRAPCC
jgi:hypothetical protein